MVEGKKTNLALLGTVPAPATPIYLGENIMAKSKFDPLEEAKVSDSKKKSSPKKEAPMPPPVVEAAPAEAPKTNRRYTVLEARTMNVAGAITTVAKGNIISEQQYGGAKGVAALMQGGLRLEEIKD
jgi:hypothetical protein